MKNFLYTQNENVYTMQNNNYTPKHPLHTRMKTSKIKPLFRADPDRIGLLGKPPAAEHSFPSKSQ
jgi:hypothetical protein